MVNRLGTKLALVFSVLFLAACAENLTQAPKEFEPSDLVYPLLDTENSRWFFFASANRPFGMVNLSPDTEVDGAWGSGYRYKVDTVKGFSHIHAWQLSGLSVLPVTIDETNEKTVFEDFKSKFDHNTEKISPGYHSVNLHRYNVSVELTSTKRVGFHRYIYEGDMQPAILFNLNGMLGPNQTTNGMLRKVKEKTLVGELEIAPTHRRPKGVKLFFHISLSTKIKSVNRDTVTGNYLLKLRGKDKKVLMKVGISYTSIKNAAINSTTELPHWDFEKVVNDSKSKWNELLGRIKVKGGSEKQQQRFYTDLWHALQGRRTINDINGAYPDNTGKTFRIAQLPLNPDGKPKFNHYNSDSFWGAQWTINTLWGLVYPEIMGDFVHSLLQYEKDGGLVPRGPSGGNYTYVMTGASSTPFIVSAIQKGIITNDLESIYQALKKNHMPGGIMEKAGYEHQMSLGGGFKYYLEKGYVPYPIPEGKFGGHQDGASLTMEYAYQDWTLAQLAQKLGHLEDYDYFKERSKNYRNVFDTIVGWMRPKNVDGVWREDYDPYEYEHGFNESNGAQSTWFVPHDINGLAKLMGGDSMAVEKLNNQFEAAKKLGFTSGSSHDKERHPEYRRIPINYGNQPSMQTSFIFNQLGRPDLTQYWSQQVVNKVFNGLSPATGYNGDEDQGLMGSLAVLMKIGLFQMNGGTEGNPKYELSTPLFDDITLMLPNNKELRIRVNGRSQNNIYIKSIKFNGNNVEGHYLNHQDLLKGGILEYNLVENPTLGVK